MVARTRIATWDRGIDTRLRRKQTRHTHGKRRTRDFSWHLPLRRIFYNFWVFSFMAGMITALVHDLGPEPGGSVQSLEYRHGIWACYLLESVSARSLLRLGSSLEHMWGDFLLSSQFVLFDFLDERYLSASLAGDRLDRRLPSAKHIMF